MGAFPTDRQLCGVKPVNSGDRFGRSFPALYIVSQGHGRRGVPRRCLGKFDVLGLVVQVRQDCGTEANGGDIFREASITLDALTHSADLRIGQGLVPAEQKFTRRFHLLQIGQSQGGQPNGAVTALRFGILDLRLVAVGMGHGPPNVKRHVTVIQRPFWAARRVARQFGAACGGVELP